MSDQYGYKILLDNIDVTNKVKNFTINCSLDSYCRELSFDLYDFELYDSLDFSIIPEAPRVEVFTRITSLGEYEDVWISQGFFFIEKPTFQVGVNETTTGIWGRQSTAVLGEPFAQKVTKLWEEATSFYAICQEIIESVGLVWDYTKCEISDFTIYADTFEASDQYPIEVLQNLVDLIVGAEGFVTSDRLGNICIKRLVRSPVTAVENITDLVVQSINEEPEWPEFGNRIKIIPTETVSQNTIEIKLSGECIGMSTGVSYIYIAAQALDGEGVPLNNEVVVWSFSPVNAKYLGFIYPALGGTLQKTASQNSARILLSKEIKRASGTRIVETDFKADEIVGIWTYGDTNRVRNFAPIDGYAIDGKKVYLTYEEFDFCDQMVIISYYASGMVFNTVMYNGSLSDPTGDDTFGEASIVATFSSKESFQTIYINNFCKCASNISVTVDPSSIEVGHQSTLTVLVENGGMPVSGLVRMLETTGNGTLQWTSLQTALSSVAGEKTEAINSIIGVTQCLTNSMISIVTGVYTISTVMVNGVETEYRGNFNYYGSFNGRTIDLNVHLPTGTLLVVDYMRSGSVVNYLTGTKVGTAQVVTSLDVNTEEGLSQASSITIVAAETEPGGGGGTTKKYPVIVMGPTLLTKWMVYYGYDYNGCYRLAPLGWKNTNDAYLVQSTCAVTKGNGIFHITGNGNPDYLLEALSPTPPQVIEITITGRIMSVVDDSFVLVPIMDVSAILSVQLY